MYIFYYYLFAFSNQYIGVVKLFMSISIDPEKFAELVVGANPSKKENPEDIAKDSIDIYSCLSFSRKIYQHLLKLLRYCRGIKRIT